jgi:hydroxypyruvate isomerase
MPKFSANLSMLFTEADFMERFELAARAGFRAVEYMFPYSYDASRIAEALRTHRLKQVLFNLPAGNWQQGERGIALLQDRRGEFEDGISAAIHYAKTLDCSLVNCLVGLTPPDVPKEKVREVLVTNLRLAAGALAKEGIRLVIESVNTRDMPGFYLSRTADVLGLIREVNHKNLYYQYDIYHMQVMEGDITMTIRNNINTIAHMQLADNPGRHEPGTGEINYTNLFRFMDEMGYTGYIGCEYKPLTTTEEGLGWIKPYL